MRVFLGVVSLLSFVLVGLWVKQEKPFHQEAPEALQLSSARSKAVVKEQRFHNRVAVGVSRDTPDPAQTALIQKLHEYQSSTAHITRELIESEREELQERRRNEAARVSVEPIASVDSEAHGWQVLEYPDGEIRYQLLPTEIQPQRSGDGL